MVRVEDKGLVVELPLDVEAFVPGSELKDGPRNFQDHYHEGDELELRVIRFDKGRKDIVLSETAKERDQKHEERQKERREKARERREQQESVRDYQETQESEEDDTSGPTTLGELSGLADLKAEMQQAERQEAQQDVPEPEDVETADAEEAEADEADADEADAEEADVAEADAGEAEAADEADAAAAETGDDSADDEEAEATASFDEQDGFPEHFPRASRLENAGVTSLAELREIDDFETIEGIGPSYADDIRAGLEEFDETGAITPEEDA